MDRTTRKAGSRYNGPAEVWVDGTKRFDADVQLIGYVEITEVETMGRVAEVEGGSSWNGQVVGGPNEGDLYGVLAQTVELRLLGNQRNGKAVVLDTGGRLQGVGEIPF